MIDQKRQPVREQRLQIIKAEKSGDIEVLHSLSKHKEEKTIEEIFAANWTILQMVRISDERVLLLMERDKPVNSGKRPAPF